MDESIDTHSMESSEGIQMEYIAIFIAVLFPGALVAFNQELLQVLPRAAALRIYSAGIWHNALCCAACGLALFVLPFVLYPLYIHSENPMVLDVSSTSPVSGYLSTGDIIVSLDGMPIHNVQDWVQLTSYIHQQALSNFNQSKDFISNNGRKGYCVPRFLMEKSRKTELVNNQSVCPKDLTAFSTLSCSQSDYSVLDYAKRDNQDSGESGHCLAANAIVKLNKCGDGWLNTNSSRCKCSEDEHCVAPVLPGLAWVEITYSSLSSSKCLHLHSDAFPGSENIDYGGKCGGTFVFIGDLSFMVRSVQMSSYQPRWVFSFGVYFPHILEKLLMSTYHVSLTLALLNSLPVYFLDGEAVLEVLLGYFNALSYHSREKALQAWLFGGTLLSILAFLRMLIVNLL